MKSLVESVCRSGGWAHVAHDRTAAITVALRAGRTQVVELVAFEHSDERLVRLTTRVGPKSGLSVSRYEKALLLNFSMPYGQMALDGEHLVITETRPLETTTPEALSVLVQFIARQADLYEKVLFKQDAN